MLQHVNCVPDGLKAILPKSDAAYMRALSIRQPYAELMRRGPAVSRIKPIEYRSRPTKIIGERFYIYASRQWAAGKLFLEGCRGNAEIRTPAVSKQNAERRLVTSDNLEVPTAGLPEPWMLELANMLILKDLPTGVIVGSGVIEMKRTPALALTAFAREADQRKALALGFDRRLGKPVDPDELISALMEIAAIR